ncbi:MAG: hypothetical protein P8165_17320, partial [Deltaproteobacteria bacterium]
SELDKISTSATFPISTFNDALVYQGELTQGTHIFMLAIDPLVNGIKDVNQWNVEVEVVEVE